MARPESIGEAMLAARVEFLKRNATETAVSVTHIDMWKDLTRVFTGRELNREIIARCEAWGIDCSHLKRKR